MESSTAAPAVEGGDGGGMAAMGGGGGGGGGDPCAGLSTYTATRFAYAKNGETVTFVMGEQWCSDGVSCPPANTYSVSYAREFRYDGARARYMNRPLNPATFAPHATQPTVWSDYDGDEIYGDFTVSGSTVTNKRSFSPGMARTENPLTTPVTDYYHGDMLGTTRLMTTNPPAPGTPTAIEHAVYTAFGERINPSTVTDSTRYGYVGAYGYQAHSEMPYLHVGARYYDPSSGRFLQRDPIGIAGGRNVYVYVSSAPTWMFDPHGEWGIFGFEFNDEWASNFWGDIGKGSAATADGFIPLVDPFSGFYDPAKDPGTKWSKRGGKFAYLCISGPRAISNLKNIINNLRSPNPPPFVSPFPPMPQGPFIGGGQPWTPGAG